jgi:hypothetical protein
MGNDMMTAMTKAVEAELNKNIDAIIEQKVEEFRLELLKQKNIAIASIIGAIEISSRPEYRNDEMIVSIRFAPDLNSRYGRRP